MPQVNLFAVANNSTWNQYSNFITEHTSPHDKYDCYSTLICGNEINLDEAKCPNHDHKILHNRELSGAMPSELETGAVEENYHVSTIFYSLFFKYKMVIVWQQKHQGHPSNVQHRERNQDRMWLPTENGFIKINCDWAINLSSTTIGISFMCQGLTGTFL